MSKRILIIFAKEPRKGRVKSRLEGRLSRGSCVKLYKLLLRDTVKSVRKINCCKKVIAYDAVNKEPAFLKRIARGFEFYRQKGKDLGERMFDAFKTFGAEGAAVVIIGSDAPGLASSRMKKAFAELNNNDLVLGPAYDGGYYLIGLKKPCNKIFKGIKWSSGSVFKRTLKKAREMKKKVALLKPWHDIDRPQDLKHLKRGKVGYEL